MKLLINDKYEEVGYLSFMKCYFLAGLGLMVFIYGGILVLAIAFALMFG